MFAAWRCPYYRRGKGVKVHIFVAYVAGAGYYLVIKNTQAPAKQVNSGVPRAALTEPHS